MKTWVLTWLRAYGWYVMVCLAVCLPLLAPGYILTLDMVFTPQLRLPDSLTSDYPFYLLLHLLDQVLPSELIQKIMLPGIILLAAIGLHRLLGFLQTIQSGAAWQWGVYAASILFAVNPYTYSRFMAGQYLVLIGYALLPWFMRLVLEFVQGPSRTSALKVAGLALVIGAVSIHTLGLLAVIGCSVLLVTLCTKKTAWRAVLRYGALALVVFALGSSYWLVPVVLGQGSTVHAIQEFDAAHASAFATEGGNALSKAINVLRLQGFWTERHGLYLLPQDQLPGWGTVRLVIWVLVGAGAAVLWRQQRRLAVMLLLLLAAGLLLSIGTFQPLLTAIGYREPHKFAGLVVLAFAVCAAYGTAWLLQKAGQKSSTLSPKSLPNPVPIGSAQVLQQNVPEGAVAVATGSEETDLMEGLGAGEGRRSGEGFGGWGTRWRYSLTAATILLAVILFTPTMYWGLGGQLTPRQYPGDWFALNQRLDSSDSGQYPVLFLPWHQYMSFGFAGRIIANPAPHFFDRKVIISNNPELEGIRQPRGDPLVASLAALLPAAAERTDLGAQLATHHIAYVILAKEFDYQNYAYLDLQKDLAAVWGTPTVKLYRNLALEGIQ